MKRLFTLLALAGTALLWNGCRVDRDQNLTVLPSELSGKLANDWFALTLQLTKETPGFSPPVAARAFGYTGLTLYEALVQGMPGYRSMQGQLTDFAAGTVPAPDPGQDYHWGIVANRALAVLTANLYKTATPANLGQITQLEQQTEQAYVTELKGLLNPYTVDRSRALGEAIGQAMYDFSVTDGRDECYANNTDPSYVPPVFDGCWVPTAPNGKALQPRWGDTRPFLTQNIAETQPEAPIAFSTAAGSAFHNEAKEVYDAAQNLTEEQERIAKFWSDDPVKTATPPGHSIAILRQVLEQENADLATAAEAYAKVGMAVHDAFISCWKAKFTFCLMRPVTYIQQYIDPNFTTLLPTPMFPEYTSGHSVQSGAAFTVMTDLFGNGYAFTDQTHALRTDIDGTPRAFSSFMAAAQEAAISRLYGGIHFRAAIDRGVQQGVEIGENINGLSFH